ncbi:delta(14)-sterol reductase LBR [Rhinophrynus dorsalis]
MPDRKFDDGETVMGRWPGSSLYYEVQVVTYDIPTQLYTVRYKDGTELELKESDLKSMNMFRTKKRSSASPSKRRSRSRSRSPGRTSKNIQTQPSVIKERKKEVLQVHLTPLKLRDYNIGKPNGEPERIEKPVVHHELKPDNVVEEVTKQLKVLRYSLSPRKEEVPMTPRKEEVPMTPRKEEVPMTPRKEEVPMKASLKEMVVEEYHDENKKLEFRGTIGAFFMILFIPPLLYVLLVLGKQKDTDIYSLYTRFAFPDLWNSRVFGFFLLWILLQALFFLLPLGKVSDGIPLANGKRLKYRINGFHAFLLTSAAVALMMYNKINLLYLYEHYLQFAASATLFSFLLSIYLYARSFKVPNEELSWAGNTGNFVYQFVVGRELNPHIGKFDLKYFSALRPGLIGWGVINFIMVLAEIENQHLEMPSVSMIMINSFQLLYIIHSLWNEECLLISPDTVNDGFGFMMAFGNLVWVPFTYSLQALYLVNNPVDMSWSFASFIISLNIVGFIIFRVANKQKYAFRKNPDDPRLAQLKTFPTAAGSKLLVSGLWGLVRHPNYLGDIIMALAWCFTCGFDHILPYFYVIFLTSFLIHRETRDEHKCKIKYGLDWEKYCQHVPYRIFPYVY